MKKKLQLIALPTDKEGVIGLINSGTQWILLRNPPYQDNINKGVKENTINPHHLYLLSDEQIKENDWFLLYMEKSGWQIRQLVKDMETSDGIKTHLTDWVVVTGSKKIIATTNPAILPYYTSRDENDEYSCIHCGQKNIERNAYGTWWTLCKCVQAKIPHSLVEEWVKRQGKMDNVMVEYAEGEEYLAGGSGDNEIWTNYPDKLKVNLSCEIIWSPVEERMYSREEVKQMFLVFAMEDAYSLPLNRTDRRAYIDKWFEENYPQ